MAEIMKQQFQHSISPDDIKDLPVVGFEGNIVIVDSSEKLAKACEHLAGESVIGFDTETRPSFKAGVSYNVSLIQLSTADTCYLIRLGAVRMERCLMHLLESRKTLKVGVDVLGDIPIDNGNPEKKETTVEGILNSMALIFQKLEQLERNSMIVPTAPSIVQNLGCNADQQYTINVTAKMFDDIKTAVAVYRSVTARLSAELDELIYDLVDTDFIGASASGFLEFYNTNIKPANRDGVANLLCAIDDIADAAKEATLGLDDQLGKITCQIAKQ